ncbi:hypothetical protein FRC06_002876 [Ceratobasidium sp. 370]|nr:hypothetical protein FRC06_002876 [Ceratobasidium sp. 370]
MGINQLNQPKANLVDPGGLGRHLNIPPPSPSTSPPTTTMTTTTMVRTKKSKQKAVDSLMNTMVQETLTKPQLTANTPVVTEEAVAADAKQATSARKANQGAGAGQMKTAVVAVKGGAVGAPAPTTNDMDVNGLMAEIGAPAQDLAKSLMGADSTTVLSKQAKVGDGCNMGDGDNVGKGRKVDSALVGTKGKGEGRGKGKDTGQANDDEGQSECENEDEGGGKDDKDDNNNNEDEDKDEDMCDDEREQHQGKDYDDGDSNGDGKDQSEHGKDVQM